MATPYRDDREALEERLASLQAELTRVREALKSLGDEERAAASLEKEIANLRARLEDRARHGDLERLRIAAPCNADWSTMKGDDRARFCGSCQKNVYDLSKLNRGEAEQLIAKHEGPPPCIRLYKRRDGTVITSDCPVGRARLRVRRVVAASVGGALLATSALMLRWRLNAYYRNLDRSMGAAAVEETIVVTAGMASSEPAPEGTSAEPPPSAATDADQPAAPLLSLSIRANAPGGAGEADNVRAIVASMSPALGRCVGRQANGQWVRMSLEVGPNGNVTSVTPRAATLAPPIVDCIMHRIEAAHFPPTDQPNATIGVEIDVHRQDGAGIDGAKAR